MRMPHCHACMHAARLRHIAGPQIEGRLHSWPYHAGSSHVIWKIPYTLGRRVVWHAADAWNAARQKLARENQKPACIVGHLLAPLFYGSFQGQKGGLCFL